MVVHIRRRHFDDRCSSQLNKKLPARPLVRSIALNEAGPSTELGQSGAKDRAWVSWSESKSKVPLEFAAIHQPIANKARTAAAATRGTSGHRRWIPQAASQSAVNRHSRTARLVLAQSRVDP